MRVLLAVAISGFCCTAWGAPGFLWRDQCYPTARLALVALCDDFGTQIWRAPAGPFAVRCIGASTVGPTTTLMNLSRRPLFSGGPAPVTQVVTLAQIPACNTDTLTLGGLRESGWLSAIAAAGLLLLLMFGFSVGRRAT